MKTTALAKSRSTVSPRHRSPERLSGAPLLTRSRNKKKVVSARLAQTPRVHEPFDHEQMRWPEMVQYSFCDKHELRIFRWNLAEAEIKAVESGDLSIRFEGEGAMHYLVTEIEPGHQCFRAPIAWWLLPARDCPLPRGGAQIRVVLVDGKSGLVEAVREIAFDRATVSALVDCLAHQAGDRCGHLKMDLQFKQDLQIV